MKYFISPCVYGGYRIWILTKHISVPGSMREFLNILSKWGGPDKRGEHWICWEYAEEYQPAVIRICTRHHYQAEEFDT